MVRRERNAGSRARTLVERWRRALASVVVVLRLVRRGVPLPLPPGWGRE